VYNNHNFVQLASVFTASAVIKWIAYIRRRRCSVPEMTYNVFSGTLNPILTHSLTAELNWLPVLLYIRT